MFSPRTRLARHSFGAVLRGVLAFSLFGCGGQVEVDGGATGGGGTGGVGGTGATGGLGGTGATGGVGGAGWTECSTPDWAVCGTPECPEGRPGCSLCFPAKGPGLFGICAETFPANAVPWKAADGKIFVGLFPTIDEKPGNILEAPFSAGVFLAAHGQAARVSYADHGVWTGDPLPLPGTCPSIADVPSCGGNCGGCPSGQICTGRSPRHPYGICVPTDSYCSLNPAHPDLPCDQADDCFVFKVEPDRQPAADALGFCLPKAICAASAATLPGGGRCE